MEGKLRRRVVDLEFNVRVHNALRREGIVYIGDLVQKTEVELLQTPNFGRKSLNEVKEVLAGMGLRLASEIPDWPPTDIKRQRMALAALWDQCKQVDRVLAVKRVELEQVEQDLNAAQTRLAHVDGYLARADGAALPAVGERFMLQSMNNSNSGKVFRCEGHDRTTNTVGVMFTNKDGHRLTANPLYCVPVPRVRVAAELRSAV